MRRFWVRIVTGLAAGGGIAVLASACAHNDSSFFLEGVLAPPQSATTSGCVFTGDPTQAVLASGWLDVGVTDAYYAEFLAGNQITPQANQQQNMTETSRITIQGAVVRIVDEVSGAQLADYTTYGSNTISPANGTTPGYAAVNFMIVDPDTVTKLAAALAARGVFTSENILTHVTAFGQTLGGDHVESNEFEYQITVCLGCLVEFSQVLPTIACNGPAPTTGAALCEVGQDVGFDCHRCLGNPICDCGSLTTCP